MNLDFLKQKKYGLPVWAWAAIAAAVLLLLYTFYKRRSGGSSSSSPADTSGELPPSTQVPISTNPGDGGGGSGGFTPDPNNGSDFWKGFSPPVTPNFPGITIELAQPDTTQTRVTHTTPPKSPSASVSKSATIASSSPVSTNAKVQQAGLGGLQTTSQLKDIASKIGTQPPIKTHSTKSPPAPPKPSTTKPKTNKNPPIGGMGHIT